MWECVGEGCLHSVASSRRSERWVKMVRLCGKFECLHYLTGASIGVLECCTFASKIKNVS